MRGPRSALVLVVVGMLCVACAPVPFAIPVLPRNEEGKPIDNGMIAFIRPGTTTKADVIWELGVPDEWATQEGGDADVTADDWIAYKGRRLRGGVIWGVALLMFPMPVPSDIYVAGNDRRCRRPWALKISFDQADIVTRYALTNDQTECTSQPFSDSTRRRW